MAILSTVTVRAADFPTHDVPDQVALVNIHPTGAEVFSTPTGGVDITDVDVAIAELEEEKQGIDADLNDLADGCDNYYAANVEAALEEVNNDNASGRNASDTKVNWKQIGNMPSVFPDGVDDGSTDSFKTDGSGAKTKDGITHVAMGLTKRILTLADFIAAQTDSTVFKIVLNDAITLTESEEILKPLRINRGGQIITNGNTLTISAAFEAGDYQVFNAASGEVVFGDGVVNFASPQWWGADANGTTDDTASVAAALSSGSTILSGKYKVTDDLSSYVRSNSTIKGVGDATIHPYGDMGVFGGFSTARITNWENVTFRDFTIDGTNQTNGGGIHLSLLENSGGSTDSNVSIIGVNFLNLYGNAVFAYDVDGFIVQDCYIDTTRYGGGVQVGEGAINVIITNNHILNIWDAQFSPHAAINSRGGRDAGARKVLFVKNICSANSSSTVKPGIVVNGAIDIVIDGNTILDNKSQSTSSVGAIHIKPLDMDSAQKPKNIVVRENTIYSAETAGISVVNTDGGIDIEGNTVLSATTSGVYVSSSNGIVRIRGNTLSHRIYVSAADASTVEVSNNSIDTFDNAIRAFATPNLSITDNKIYIDTTETKYGIKVIKSANSILSNNRIYNSASSSGTLRAIQLVGSINSYITENRVYGHAQYGLHADNTSDGLWDENNYFGPDVTTIKFLAGTLRRNSGKSVENGGSNIYSITHGLSSTPTQFSVTPGSTDTDRDFSVTADATNITVKFSSLTQSGTKNIVLIWKADNIQYR